MGEQTDIQKITEAAALKLLKQFFPTICKYHHNGIDLQKPFVEVKGTGRETLPLNMSDMPDYLKTCPDLLFACIFLKKNTIALFFAKDAYRITNSVFSFQKLVASPFTLIVSDRFDANEFTAFFDKNAPESVRSLLVKGEGSVKLVVQKINACNPNDKNHMVDKRKVLAALDSLLSPDKVIITYRTFQKPNSWGNEGHLTHEKIIANPGCLFVLLAGNQRGEITEIMVFFQKDVDLGLDAKPPWFAESSMGKHRKKPWKLALSTIRNNRQNYPQVLFCKTIDELHNIVMPLFQKNVTKI